MTEQEIQELWEHRHNHPADAQDAPLPLDFIEEVLHAVALKFCMFCREDNIPKRVGETWVHEYRGNDNQVHETIQCRGQLVLLRRTVSPLDPQVK